MKARSRAMIFCALVCAAMGISAAVVDNPVSAKAAEQDRPMAGEMKKPGSMQSDVKRRETQWMQKMQRLMQTEVATPGHERNVR